MVDCPSCGKEVAEATAFCPFCGKSMKERTSGVGRFVKGAGIGLFMMLLIFVLLLAYGIIVMASGTIVGGIAPIGIAIIGIAITLLLIFSRIGIKEYRKDAYNLLKSDKPNPKELDDTIKALSRQKDEEAKELTRRLISKKKL